MILISKKLKFFNYIFQLLINLFYLKILYNDISLSNNLNNNATDDMYCPITHQLMNNPYIDQEGNTYEFDAIMQMVKCKSYITSNKKSVKKELLRPNRALKNAIDKIRE